MAHHQEVRFRVTRLQLPGYISNLTHLCLDKKGEKTVYVAPVKLVPAPSGVWNPRSSGGYSSLTLSIEEEPRYAMPGTGSPVGANHHSPVPGVDHPSPLPTVCLAIQIYTFQSIAHNAFGRKEALSDPTQVSCAKTVKQAGNSVAVALVCGQSKNVNEGNLRGGLSWVRKCFI